MRAHETGDFAWTPGPTTVELAAWDLVKRCRRMLDGWAESTPEVRARDLWTPLHIAAEDLANVLEDSGHTTPEPVAHNHTRFRNDAGPWSPCPVSCPAAGLLR